MSSNVYVLCMSRAYKAYTDEEIIQYAAEVTSLAGLLRKLGLAPRGGNYETMRKNLQRLHLTCDHWKGQGWNKGHQTKDWSEYSKVESLKPHVIRKRGHICEDCNLGTWNGRPISLELHHKDGDRTNNEEENLELLCPNCHSYTDTYKGRNINAHIGELV